MQIGSFSITSPALEAPARSEAEAFGSVAWLYMQTPKHQDMPLHALNSVVLPPLKAGQYILASALQRGSQQPVAYMAWATFSADAESRYLENPSLIGSEDWTSGDRMWITDWFTPFGHSAEFSNAAESLLPNSCLRALYHRGNERGLRIKEALNKSTPTQA
jgi:cytolysin-activating lysine-acyltransferase